MQHSYPASLAPPPHGYHAIVLYRVLEDRGVYNHPSKPPGVHTVSPDHFLSPAERGIVNKRQTRARVNLSVFLTAKPGGKYRFIWNGKPLSPYLDKTAFSYELLSRFLEGILDGSHLGKLDLVDGFFALKVKESQRQYLGFSLENEQGILEYYEFCVLPQGITTTAPFIFSRFTLAITSYLRRTLFMVLFITYLDDLGWAIRPGYSPEERTRINEYIRLTFVRAGWVLSETKSIFANNVTELILLGVLIRTVPCLQIDIPPARKKKYLSLIDAIIQAPSSSPRMKLQICGSIQSCEIVLGPSITLYFRYNYLCIAATIGDGSNLLLWNTKTLHTAPIIEEFQHWRTRLSGDTSITFRHPPWVFSDTLFAVDGYSDASNRALGSVVMPYDSAATDTPRGPSYWFSKVSPNAGLIYQKYGHELSVKLLTLAQILESSTLRELRGIVHMTLVHLPQWEGKHIRIFTDNAAVPKVLLRGYGATPPSPGIHRPAGSDIT